jgi:hypothetical protein
MRMRMGLDAPFLLVGAAVALAIIALCGYAGWVDVNGDALLAAGVACFAAAHLPWTSSYLRRTP